MSLYEGEVRGLIAEARRAVVAHQPGILAQQDQIEIVIVIVVDPDRLLIMAGGQLGGMLLKLSLLVDVHRRAGFGENAQIRQAIVVEIAGGDGDDVFQAFEAAGRNGRRSVFQEHNAARRPCQRVGLAIAIEIERQNSRAFRIELGGHGDIAEFQLRRILIGRLRFDGLVDLRVEAPLHILGDSRPFGALLGSLKQLQLAGAVFRAARLAVGVVKLEMRSGQARIEPGRNLEFRERGLEFVADFVCRTQVVVGFRFIWRKPGHLLELRDGLVVGRFFLVDDPQIEPGVRNLRILFLRLLDFSGAFFGFPRAQQSQPVIQPLTRRVRRKLQAFLEFVHSLHLRRWILVESFPQISMPPQFVFFDARGVRPRQQHGKHERCTA